MTTCRCIKYQFSDALFSMYRSECYFSDVLALAASIGELSILCRKARTANWCALQLADKDNAPLTSLGFEIKTEITKDGFPVYVSQQNVIELQDGGEEAENSESKGENK
jgi:hypothetical protein